MKQIKCLVNQEMKSKRFIISKMEIEEVDLVLSIANTSSLNPWSRGMLLEETLNPISHCFVMKGEEKSMGIPIIGFICFRNIGDESELLNIGVHPLYRKRGFGKKLMEFYIDFCSKREINKYYLEVSASNIQAIHLYHSFAFQPMGEKKRFYQGKFDALLMVR
ncbi:MAG: ribosomal protein S18-alanine N-acetyltransferase [Thermodesulfobacteriota bacterium]|nr:ribosomal protein S18-alanine N-acetyltransferase [Thermodesulfobacteriota bacterium]